MKKLVSLMLAVMLALAIMAPALADEPVTISFFDKNSGVRTFDDPIAKELEARTGNLMHYNLVLAFALKGIAGHVLPPNRSAI